MTCRSNELRRFILADRWAESRGCWHIATFPQAQHCDRYEREPGADDEKLVVVERVYASMTEVQSLSLVRDK